MTLQSKLSNLKADLFTKFGKQEGTIVFHKEVITRGAKFGQDYGSNVATNVSLTSGCKVRRAKAYNTKSDGTVQVGDLFIEVPQHLLTETQLTDTKDHGYIDYLSQHYTLLNYNPSTVINSVPLSWVVQARLRK